MLKKDGAVFFDSGLNCVLCDIFVEHHGIFKDHCALTLSSKRLPGLVRGRIYTGNNLHNDRHVELSGGRHRAIFYDLACILDSMDLKKGAFWWKLEPLTAKEWREAE